MKSMRLATEAMRTRFELVLVGERRAHVQAAGEEAIQEIHQTENQLSRFLAGSEVCCFNESVCSSSPDELRRLAAEFSGFSPQTREVLRICEDVRKASHGAFDVFSLPSLADDTCCSLDLGGIGKGVALDRAAIVLREAQIESAFLHGGTSSVLAWGCDPETNEPWALEIPEREFGSLPLCGTQTKPAALGVSSPCLQEQAHLFNPARMRFIEQGERAHSLQSSAALADAWATAMAVQNAALVTP